MDTHTHTHGRYQTYYLPCYTVNNKSFSSERNVERPVCCEARAHDRTAECHQSHTSADSACKHPAASTMWRNEPEMSDSSRLKLSVLIENQEQWRQQQSASPLSVDNSIVFARWRPCIPTSRANQHPKWLSVQPFLHGHDRHTDRHTVRKIERQTDTQSVRQLIRQTDRQADRLTVRQTDTKTTLRQDVCHSCQHLALLLEMPTNNRQFTIWAF